LLAQRERPLLAVGHGGNSIFEPIKNPARWPGGLVSVHVLYHNDPDKSREKGSNGSVSFPVVMCGLDPRIRYRHQEQGVQRLEQYREWQFHLRVFRFMPKSPSTATS
jgi:hypothetical protein